ncbi:MAG: hypothetical protein A3E80_00580 [Chlamydiae bacterium RIFCSPHIGHO2_12_FULL_49_9]|nr:MAG: hypothetical protein A3E80_00580 [Chlamydiae bacterium RIFCSPHIGHO2_12_FULL_49_9]
MIPSAGSSALARFMQNSVIDLVSDTESNKSESVLPPLVANIQALADDLLDGLPGFAAISSDEDEKVVLTKLDGTGVVRISGKAPPPSTERGEKRRVFEIRAPSSPPLKIRLADALPLSARLVHPERRIVVQARKVSSDEESQDSDCRSQQSDGSSLF